MLPNAPWAVLEPLVETGGPHLGHDEPVEHRGDACAKSQSGSVKRYRS
jgi:hypothetical protein